MQQAWEFLSYGTFSYKSVEKTCLCRSYHLRASHLYPFLFWGKMHSHNFLLNQKKCLTHALWKSLLQKFYTKPTYSYPPVAAFAFPTITSLSPCIKKTEDPRAKAGIFLGYPFCQIFFFSLIYDSSLKTIYTRGSISAASIGQGLKSSYAESLSLSLIQFESSVI